MRAWFLVGFDVCPGGEVAVGVMPEDNDDGAVAGKWLLWRL